MVDQQKQGAPPSPGAAQEPFSDALLEQSFQSVRQLLQTPAPAHSAGLILLVTLVLFFFSQLGSSDTLQGIAVLVVVLMFHELGHLAGMKVFGYRDIKMFFIPFLGAAVSGRGHGAAAWKRAVVLLLGPLPGIIIGSFLAYRLATRPSPLFHSLATALVLINALNLLPVSPLDGGRFFHLLLFCRHRLLEIAFASFAALALIASVALGTYLLPIVGVLLLRGLPRQWRLRRAAESLRTQFTDWSSEPAQLPEPQLRAAFVAAQTLTAGAPPKTPRDAANTVEQLVERASLQPPSIPASFLLLLPWVAALAASLVAWSWLSLSRPPHWQTSEVHDGGFSILMPQAERPEVIERDSPFGKMAMHNLSAGGAGGFFTARWYDIPMGKKPQTEPDMAAFFDASRDKLLEPDKGTLIREERYETSRIVHIREPDGYLTIVQIRVVGQRVYLMFAPAVPADEAQRFFDSFKLLSSEGAGDSKP